jgi:hypothetical protein
MHDICEVVHVAQKTNRWCWSLPNKEDVPFDVQQVRVIYYDKEDPFSGQKLIEKVAQNVLSPLQDPKDATLFR